MNRLDYRVIYKGMIKTKVQPDAEKLLTAYCKAVEVFFAATGGFNGSKATLKKLFYYGFCEDVIPAKEEISAFRVLQKKLSDLLDVTYKVYDTGVFSKTLPDEDIFGISGHPKSEFYCDPWVEPDLSPWDWHPHFLCRQEFINPYPFFKEFFGYKEIFGWKTILEELFSASLLHQSVIDFSNSVNNAILLHDALFKFLEVSHIIKVHHNNPLKSE